MHKGVKSDMQNNPSYSNEVIAVPKNVALLMTFAFILMLVVTLVALLRPVGASLVTQVPVAQSQGSVTVSALPTVTFAPRTVTSNSRTLGTNANAPEIVEFADFQCPYCRKFALGAGRGLEEAIKQGKVRVTYKYFPFLGQESFDAAYAAECANRQGKFWEYADLLTVGWQGENIGSFTKDNLKKWAGQLKLNTAKFDACLDNQETKSVVDADIIEARSLNVRGTPTFFVNGKLYNAPSLDWSAGWITIIEKQ
jgi:protein-disulfide isomerase